MSRKSLTILLVATVFASLSGCNGGGGSHDTVGYDGAASWGNYKCRALDTSDAGRVSIGWASSESQARANALDKCSSHSNGSGSCKIADCENEM